MKLKYYAIAPAKQLLLLTAAKAERIVYSKSTN